MKILSSKNIKLQNFYIRFLTSKYQILMLKLFNGYNFFNDNGNIANVG